MASNTPLEAGVYVPKDAIGATVKAGMITTGAGLFVSAIQNTLTRQNVGSMGVLTRTGGTVAVFGGSCHVVSGHGGQSLTENKGAMGGAFEFAKSASANLREKDDAWNPAIGGFFAGSVLGLRGQE